MRTTPKTATLKSEVTVKTEKQYVDIGHSLAAYRRKSTVVGEEAATSNVGFASSADLKTALGLKPSEFKCEDKILRKRRDIFYIDPKTMAKFIATAWAGTFWHDLDRLFPGYEELDCFEDADEAITRSPEHSIDLSGMLTDDQVFDGLANGDISPNELARINLFNGGHLHALDGFPLRCRISCECPEPAEINVEKAYQHLKRLPEVSNIRSIGNPSENRSSHYRTVPFTFDVTPTQKQMSEIWGIAQDQGMTTRKHRGTIFEKDIFEASVLLHPGFGLYQFVTQKWLDGYGLEKPYNFD